MAPLGALSQSWVSAEAPLPLGWQISGLWRFDDVCIALAGGVGFDDYASGSGKYDYLGTPAPRRSAAGASRSSERFGMRRRQ